jgi:citrate lyase beta subunit
MRHFDFLSEADTERLFFRAPERIEVKDDLSRLSVALGATLYSPATRPSLAADIARRAAQGVLSSVVCLEDAVADADLALAEKNAVEQLRDYARMSGPKLMLFVRIRTVDQIETIVRGLGDDVGILTGFVLPKFTAASGGVYLDAIVQAAAVAGTRLLAMPVIESEVAIYAETRVSELLAIRRLLSTYRDTVLAVRLGATDFSAAYGLRRSRDLSVYDVRVLADVIADVVNILGRADGSGHLITGPVWEYFADAERMFKPQLRTSPFIEHAEPQLRAELIARDLDGLIREVVLDKANGLTGKTVIHPSHVAAVHALSVVTHEEYSDAVDILETGATGGVAVSAYGNKMNESKPHTTWARGIMARADVFGVANHETSFVDLLGASLSL